MVNRVATTEKYMIGSHQVSGGKGGLLVAVCSLRKRSSNDCSEDFKLMLIGEAEKYREAGPSVETCRGVQPFMLRPRQWCVRAWCTGTELACSGAMLSTAEFY